MASAYGKIARPSPARAGAMAEILPLERQLKDNTTVRVFYISQEQVDGAIFAPRFPKLVSRMHTLFNAELEDGNTYPQEELLDDTQFCAYFLAYDAFVVVQVSTGGDGVLVLDDGTADWEAHLLGFFYVKPNFPGRCSHICNGGFFTAPVARNRGVGRCMAEAFLKVAPSLGYKSSMFNLVFVNNAASVKLWRSLGFREIGLIPKAGRLRSSPELVDAIMFYYDFTQGNEAL
ncbi:unnamed protein product [Calypogeia fissa]